MVCGRLGRFGSLRVCRKWRLWLHLSCKLRGASGRDSFAFVSGRAMRPKERRESGQNDLFRARLDQIVDMGHPLAKLPQGAARWPMQRDLDKCFIQGSGGRPHEGRAQAGRELQLNHLATRRIGDKRPKTVASEDL